MSGLILVRGENKYDSNWLQRWSIVTRKITSERCNQKKLHTRFNVYKYSELMNILDKIHNSLVFLKFPGFPHSRE